MKPAPSVDKPWLMADVTAWLEAHLQPDWRVLETGCGGSTVFFAERVAHVISYENSQHYAGVTAGHLLLRKLDNVELRLHVHYPVNGLGLQAGLPGATPSLDLAFIDGRGRVRSVIDALPAIKPGGYLILDDSDRQRYQEAHRAANAVCEEVATFVSGPDHTTMWRKR